MKYILCLAVYFLALNSGNAAVVCQQSDFKLVEAVTVVIKFSGMSYSPKCLKVRPGTKITIPASTMHPLMGNAAIGGIANPLATATPLKVAQTKIFSTTGLFGYFCVNHGNSAGEGMAAQILVEKK